MVADSVNPTDLHLKNIDIKGTPVNEKIILFFRVIMFNNEVIYITVHADKIFSKRN
jgi:hypothetical protein